MSGSRVRALQRFAARLRFPQLFLLTLLLFAGDLLVPDLIPLADEILLGLVTLLLGMWKERKSGGDPVASPVAGDAVQIGSGGRSTRESDSPD